MIAFETLSVEVEVTSKEEKVNPRNSVGKSGEKRGQWVFFLTRNLQNLFRRISKLLRRVQKERKT